MVDIRTGHRASKQAGGVNWLNATLVCAILVVVGFTLWPVTARDPFHPAAICLSNVRRMTLGLLMYTQDYDDRLPPSRQWMDAIGAYGVKPYDLRCPEVARKNPGDYGYALNSSLPHLRVAENARPQTLPLAFDSVFLDRNASSGLHGLPDPGRHDGKNSVSFLDGHVEMVAPKACGR